MSHTTAMATATATTTTPITYEAPLREDERQRCEVWTRVMGYHRPVSSFNTGKKGEFAERLYFEEARAAARQAPCPEAVDGTRVEAEALEPAL